VERVEVVFERVEIEEERRGVHVVHMDADLGGGRQGTKTHDGTISRGRSE